MKNFYWVIISYQCSSRPVRVTSFLPDNVKVLSCSNDTTSRVWDLATGDCLMNLEGHKVCLGDEEFKNQHNSQGSCPGSCNITNQPRNLNHRYIPSPLFSLIRIPIFCFISFSPTISTEISFNIIFFQALTTTPSKCGICATHPKYSPST